MNRDAVLELLPVDIAPYAAGNTGVAYVHRFTAAEPGPTLMINALTHGNEVCGAHALDVLLRAAIRPRRGTLILSFANVAAYETFDPAQPTASRFLDEDFNRLWAASVLDGPRRSRELDRARTLRPFIAEADYLLDLHSMQLPAPALMLCGEHRKGRDLALKVAVPSHVVADTGHANGTRMRDHGAFSDAASPKTALLAECGQHWERLSRTVAIETCLRWLVQLGALEVADAERVQPLPPVPPPRLIEVTDRITIASPNFRFVRDFKGLEVIPEAGTVIGYDEDRPVATPYGACVLIMPSRRLALGQTAVRLGRFVTV